jgi:hypothetical protein
VAFGCGCGFRVRAVEGLERSLGAGRCRPSRRQRKQRRWGRRFRAHRRRGIGRGGGAFDGGGASASFAEGGGKAPAVAVGDFSLGEIAGDDIGAIILLIVLALAIFVASGYLVWMAPEILTEAAFGAVLAGGLAKKAKQQSATGWVAGVVKKTWWPFAIVFLLAMVFAFYAKAHHPEAKTFREAIRSAVSS